MGRARRRSRDKSEATDINTTSAAGDTQPCTSPSTSTPPAPTPTPQQIAAQIAEDAAWKQEHEYMSYQLGRRGMMIKRLATDGNCMFRALSDQLMGTPDYHSIIRQQICDYMEQHADQFEPFIDRDNHTWSSYLTEMRCDATWGDHLELTAASHRYHVNIMIHQSDEKGMSTTRIGDTECIDPQLIQECKKWDDMMMKLVQEQQHTKDSKHTQLLRHLWKQSTTTHPLIPLYQHIMSYPSRVLHFSYHRRAHYNSIRACHDRDIAEMMRIKGITYQLGEKEGIITPTEQKQQQPTHNTKYQPRHVRRRHHVIQHKQLPELGDDEWNGIASRLGWEGPLYLHGQRMKWEWPHPTTTTYLLIACIILLLLYVIIYGIDDEDVYVSKKSRHR